MATVLIQFTKNFMGSFRDEHEESHNICFERDVCYAGAPHTPLKQGVGLLIESHIMILKLRIECVRGWYFKETCIRVIEIDENMDLVDLHEAIQDAVNFGRDHPFEFYLANSSSPWAHKHFLIENEDWTYRESDFAKIKLKDIYPLGRKKLYYLFDFGDKWTFEIRKARGGKKPEAGIEYPRVVEAIGPDPEQYLTWED